jgi:imidazolonepropionase-like amidohydrolase
MRCTPLLGLIVLACQLTTEPPPIREQPGADSILAIRNARVITMNSEGVLAGHTILVRGDRISAIGPANAVTVPAEATIVDAGGRYVLPGLIDMHVHILREHLSAYVEHGITSVRNMWGYRELAGHMSDVAAGRVLGPRIYSLTAGFDGSPPRWPQTQLVDDVARIEPLIDAQLSQGFRELKVYTNLSPAAYDSIVAITRRRGLSFAGHVPARVSLEHVLASGQHSIEHLGGYQSEVATSGQWLSINETRMHQWAQRTAMTGTWNCPTLAVLEMLSAASAQARAMNRNRQRMVKALHDAGAMLLVGTDAGFDRMLPGSLAEELRLFVEAGLSPYQALLGATRNAATYLGLSDEIGTIKTGARADLVLLNANPLTDIRVVRSIAGIVLRGRWLPAVVSTR